VVGDEGKIAPLPVREFDLDGASGPPGAKLLEPPPLVPGPPQAHREAFGEEGEDVEDRGLAAAVGAEEGGEGGEGLELQVAERPVVLDPDRFDPRDGMAGAFLVGHGRDSEGGSEMGLDSIYFELLRGEIPC